MKKISFILLSLSLLFLPAYALADVNRITTAEGVIEAFNNIVNFTLSIISVLVFIFFVYTAFMFASAKGNPEQITNSKRQLLYVFIAIMLVVLAKSSAVIVSGLLSDNETDSNLDTEQIK